MRAEVVRVLEFVGEIDEITDAEALLQNLKTRLAPFGVSGLSVNEVYVPGKPMNPHALLQDGWQDWAVQYARHRYGADDPAVKALKERARPFAWSDALKEHRSWAAERVMDACYDHTGAREGFVVPLRDTDGAVLTAAFSGRELELDDQARGAMHLAGTYFILRGRELVQGEDCASTCPLSERQLECLRWVHAGKTDFEIAVLLGISPRTAHNHIEKAKAILNTPKRTVAAFEAWKLGWLD
jgi:LuxR family quorum sensing-dependent transcriptional regulator